MDQGNKKLKKWQARTLLLIIVAAIILTVLRLTGVIGEHVVFEKKFQYSEARADEIIYFEVQLGLISRRLADDITDEERTELESAADMISIYLTEARDKQ